MTSSETADKKAEYVCEGAGLNSSGYVSGANCHVQAYRKRAVDTPNFVECGEEDWICSAGTIIYKSRLGAEALRDFYSDLVKSGIVAARSRAIGHYALAIRHDNKVTVFTDPQGALTLYYVDTGSWWFASNSLDVCAHVLPVRRIDPIKLAMTAIQTNTPGEETFYSDVRRLFGTQVIRIDINNGTFRVENIPNAGSAESHDYSSISDAIDQYKSAVRAVFRELAAVGPIGLLGTGGLDSRTVLAALLDQGVTPQMMYGVGNSNLTDDHPHDLKVAKDVAQTFKLPFQQLDWSGEQPHSHETMQELFKTYGFQYEIYGAPQSFLRGFSGSISPYPKLFLGGRGPALTNRKPWMLAQTSFSFDDLVEYAISPDVKSQDFICREAYRSNFSQEVKIGLGRGQKDYPADGASLKTFAGAFFFLYLRPDARFLNFVNEFGHYISPFLLGRLHNPLVDVPFEYRANDEFQVRLIQALAPDLLDIPLFSGHQHSRIDRETFTMKRVAEERSFPGRLADIFLPSSLRPPARKLYLRVKHGRGGEVGKLQDRNSRIVETYGRLVMSDPLAVRWLSSTSHLRIKVVERLAHYLAGVNTLGYSE